VVTAYTAEGRPKGGGQSFAAFVTTLPVSPPDGMEVTYVADATNGVLWRLKYHAASASAYKWECIGGSELAIGVVQSAVASNAAWNSFATSLSITVPLAGDYDSVFGGLIQANAGSTAQMGLRIAGVDATTEQRIAKSVNTTPTHLTSTLMRAFRATGLAAATALEARYQFPSSVGAIYDPFHRVIPVRVG
jgi:hypothetical protein